eukprot:tig00000042_g15646.t1
MDADLLLYELLEAGGARLPGFAYAESWSRHGPATDFTATGASVMAGRINKQAAEEFRAATALVALKAGQDVVRCWDYCTEWIIDVSLLPNTMFYRSAEARKVGLRTAVAVPLTILGMDVHAVLVYYMDFVREPCGEAVTDLHLCIAAAAASSRIASSGVHIPSLPPAGPDALAGVLSLTVFSRPPEFRSEADVRLVAEHLRTVPAMRKYERHLEDLARVSTIAQTRPGDLIFEEGTAGTAAYLVILGSVRLTTEAGPVSLLGPGAVIGESALLQTPALRTGRAVCAEASALLVINLSFVPHLRRPNPPAPPPAPMSGCNSPAMPLPYGLAHRAASNAAARARGNSVDPGSEDGDRLPNGMPPPPPSPITSPATTLYTTADGRTLAEALPGVFGASPDEVSEYSRRWSMPAGSSKILAAAQQAAAAAAAEAAAAALKAAYLSGSKRHTRPPSMTEMTVQAVPPGDPAEPHSHRRRLTCHLPVLSLPSPTVPTTGEDRARALAAALSGQGLMQRGGGGGGVGSGESSPTHAQAGASSSSTSSHLLPLLRGGRVPPPVAVPNFAVQPPSVIFDGAGPSAPPPRTTSPLTSASSPSSVDGGAGEGAAGMASLTPPLGSGSFGRRGQLPGAQGSFHSFRSNSLAPSDVSSACDDSHTGGEDEDGDDEEDGGQGEGSHPTGSPELHPGLASERRGSISNFGGLALGGGGGGGADGAVAPSSSWPPPGARFVGRGKISYPGQKPRQLRQKDISYEMLSAWFHVPLKVAAQHIGLSTTTIKKICRKMGIKNWPFRQLVFSTGDSSRAAAVAAAAARGRAEARALCEGRSRSPSNSPSPSPPPAAAGGPGRPSTPSWAPAASREAPHLQQHLPTSPECDEEADDDDAPAPPPQGRPAAAAAAAAQAQAAMAARLEAARVAAAQASAAQAAAAQAAAAAAAAAAGGGGPPPILAPSSLEFALAGLPGPDGGGVTPRTLAAVGGLGPLNAAGAVVGGADMDQLLFGLSDPYVDLADVLSATFAAAPALGATPRASPLPGSAPFPFPLSYPVTPSGGTPRDGAAQPSLPTPSGFTETMWD